MGRRSSHDRAKGRLTEVSNVTAEVVASPNNIARYYYDGWVHLLPDADGVRLIANDVCEFLQKVPGKFKDQST